MIIDPPGVPFVIGDTKQNVDIILSHLYSLLAYFSSLTLTTPLELSTALLSYVTEAELSTALTPYVTETELTTALTPYMTAEGAQDAVGAIVTDTATIDLTYNDAGPTLSAALVTPVTVANGGTGAADAATARNNLGLNSTKTRVENLPFNIVNQTTGLLTGPGSMVDAATSIAEVTWRVPEGYSSGDITFHYLYTVNSPGVLDMAWFTARFREGSAGLSIDAGVGNAQGPTVGITYRIPRTIAATNFTVGDVLQIQLVRFGTSGTDSSTAVMTIVGAYVSYTGLAWEF